MAQQTIKDLKKGEFFTRKPIDNPTENQVWIRGDYDRSAKAYSCTRFSDTNDEKLMKANTKVFLSFVF